MTDIYLAVPRKYPGEEPLIILSKDGRDAIEKALNEFKKRGWGCGFASMVYYGTVDVE